MTPFVYSSVIVVVISFMANVHCVQVPSGPSGVSATKNSSQTIMVQWNKVLNTTVYMYEVYYKKIDDNNWNTKFVDGNQTSVLIDSLTPYTVYLVKIKANTTDGVSNFSSQVSDRTGEALPGELPKITTIKAVNCCSIYLEWNPISADKANGVLLGYYIYYLKEADMSDYMKKHKKVSININVTKANLTGFQPNTEYLVGVAVYNSKGVDSKLASLQHVERVQTLEGAPSAPSGLTGRFVSSSVFVIQWTLIPDDKANGVVLGYRYVVYNHQYQIVKNGTVSNSTNSSRITNMNRCANYTVHLRAWTAGGAGINAVFNFTNICASPKIIDHKKEVILFAYKTGVLHCKYTGYPPPTITWIWEHEKAPLGRIQPSADGSLIFTKVRFEDAVQYTCIVNNSLGRDEAKTKVIVTTSGREIKTGFLLNLTNESFHADLGKKGSERFKNLSEAIKTEVFSLDASIKKAKLRDVGNFTFRNGSVLASFIVTAIALRDPEGAKNEIVDVMITQTKDGKLGNISVGQIIVGGAPPPPDAVIISTQPTYVLLSWTRPPLHLQYQIENYSIRYRKHTETDQIKTGETVKDKDGTMKGVVTGLDAGEYYYVEVTSNRTDFLMEEKLRYKTLEVKTPDISVKQWMLTVVLPIGLAILIAFVILVLIRPYVLKRGQQNDDVPLQDRMRRPQQYGPREENPYDIGRLLEEFPCRWKEIPREDLTLGKELGAGAFGSVVRGDLKRDGKSMPCAVKMLKRFATEREHRDLFNELSIMTQVGNHANIVSLIGACTVNGPLWVIVKIAERGCLLDYLHKHRKPEYSDHAYMNVQPSTSNDDEKLDKLQKLKFGHGIARGMRHLEKMKCVHRDLAARNVLLSKGLVPMVSDFGLSRDIYASGMYEDVRGGKRPVRWMAPESIEDYTCTNKSDVWSYGVTLWEIETAGTVPYAGVDSGMDILNEIKKGYRLEQPDDCDDDVYELMIDTWNANPLDRPTFQEIADRVEIMLTGISEYLEIQNEEEDDARAYDEVHISDEQLANGYVAQDEGPVGEDATNQVRYTDIHGAAASDVPSNETSRDRSVRIQGNDNTKLDQDDENSLQTKC